MGRKKLTPEQKIVSDARRKEYQKNYRNKHKNKETVKEEIK